MNKKLRQQVYDKYNGKCAYTGKQLDHDWQVDHMHSQNSYDRILVYKSHYKNKETLEKISIYDFNNMISKYRGIERYDILEKWEYFPTKTKPHPSVNNIENLMPALRIVNHYKRGHYLESFRRYMLNFHIRLAKLPKKTVVERTISRKEYMHKVADVFGITTDKPFSGKFYFELYESTR